MQLSFRCCKQIPNLEVWIKFFHHHHLLFISLIFLSLLLMCVCVCVCVWGGGGGGGGGSDTRNICLFLVSRIIIWIRNFKIISFDVGARIFVNNITENVSKGFNDIFGISWIWCKIQLSKINCDESNSLFLVPCAISLSFIDCSEISDASKNFPQIISSHYWTDSSFLSVLSQASVIACVNCSSLQDIFPWLLIEKYTAGDDLLVVYNNSYRWTVTINRLWTSVMLIMCESGP